MTIIFVVLWVVFGLLTTLSSYAFAQREWPSLAERGRVNDSFLSIFIGLSGPFGLLGIAYASLVVSGTHPFKHGLKVPFTK